MQWHATLAKAAGCAGGDGGALWAKDLSARSGAKAFAAADHRRAWDELQRTPVDKHHFYEVIRDRPCHMFFDFDEGDCRARWDLMRPCVDAFVEELTGETPTHVVLDASKGQKKSIHVVTKLKDRFLLATPRQGSAVVDALEAMFLDDQETFGCDTTIYSKSRCFRMWRSSKMGKGRPFVADGELAWTYDHWCASLVQFGQWPCAELPIDVGKRAGSFSLHATHHVTDAIKEAIGGNDRVRRMPFSWVFVNHIRGRKCPFQSNKQHKSNNCYCRYDLRDLDQATLRCFKCRKKKKTVTFAQDIKDLVATFLQSWSITVRRDLPHVDVVATDPRQELQKVRNAAMRRWGVDVKSCNGKGAFPTAVVTRRRGKIRVDGYKLSADDPVVRRWHSRQQHQKVTLADAPLLCKARLEFLQQKKAGEDPRLAVTAHVERAVLRIAVSTSAEANAALRALESEFGGADAAGDVAPPQIMLIPMVSEEAIDAVLSLKRSSGGKRTCGAAEKSERCSKAPRRSSPAEATAPSAPRTSAKAHSTA